MLESVIKQRKSIRQFSDEPVDVQEILEILEAARFAPSGKNRQPWRIKILDMGDRETLIQLMKDKFKDQKLPGSLAISLRALEQCGRVLLLFNPYSYQEDDYSRNKMLMDTQSIGAFIQNFLLLATERGLSTLWINDIYYAKSEIESFYSDNSLEVIAAVAVGYSSIDRVYNIRKGLNEILL